MERLTTVPQASMIKCCGCIEESNCYSDISCDEIFEGIKKLKAYEDTGLEPEEIGFLERDLEKKVCTGCWLKEGKKIAEKISMLKELLEAASEEIENVYGHDTELMERIRNAL
ncbi:hypothetical protein SAMN05443270_3136 [Lacrimispora sphenoides]|uniref:hypothetical protein n=1 Tax=Lacrimispora sphenoides TaxID=29370 RepID=UPI0008B71F74|nr:hypothetical protein [Lacrimispora sphenoides]SEU09878.1 hypothetical protein SAMN05443270_3136 [Lacrimispora sphenoides]